MNERSWRRVFSRLGWSMTVFLTAAIAAQLVMVWGAGLLGIPLWGAGAQLVINAVSLYLIGFPAAAAVLKRTPSPAADRAVERWTPGMYAVVLLICVGLMGAGNAVGRGFMAVFGSAGAYNSVDAVVMNSGLILDLLLVVAAGPIVEELLTRKLLIDRILIFGEKTAVVVSALVFALIHGNFYQFFYAFGVGAVLTYVYIRTGSVKHTIALHMAVNFLGSAVALLLLEVMALPGLGGFIGLGLLLLYDALYIGAAIGGIVLLICFWKRKRFYRTPYEWTAPRMTVRDRIGIIAGNGGMLAFFAVCLFLFWLNI